MARLTIYLLGPFQVSLDSVLITGFESNKVRALLAYLAVESRQSHHREKLADLLWPELPPGRASSNLNQALYNLRRLVHDQQDQLPYLLRSRETLQFNAQSDYWLDVEALTKELEDASLQDLTRQDLESAACHDLQTAVELYRGDFLEGLAFDSSLAFDEWVLTVRYRLQRLARRGLHCLVEYYSNQEDFACALPYAWRQVELDPLDESACRQLMGLLAASGQRNQALTHFERLQAMLVEELKVPPEPETLALRDQIRGEVAAAPAEHPLLQHNLPAVLTPLIGRGYELAAIQTQLEDPATRLLTLYGPGGSGKSRLALAVAQANLAQFSHGVFLVPLNPLQSPEAILPAILEALDLPRFEHESHLAQLTRYLQDKHVLLVLDGFEHLLTGAGWLANMLRQAPGLKLLVTSRARLNLKGEQLYPLAGMRFPSKRASAEEILACDAVQLLLAGLRRARPGYQPALAEAADLWQICRRVQGMPLGLLLAASWGATLSLAEIASEVCRGLNFLSADWADVPARLRNLRATFDHTWRLLEPRQQVIFRGLSIFQGAFTRQAARIVCQASPHELRALVERSLVLNTAPGWYELHELLRQYGREKLAQSTEVEQEICTRHSAFYLERLARFGEALKSAKQPEALVSLDREHENVRAAWIWTAEQGDVAQLAPVVEALCLYYELRVRYAEGASTCRYAVESPNSRDRVDHLATNVLVQLLIWEARFQRLLGNQQLAKELQADCLQRLEKLTQSGWEERQASAFLYLEMGNADQHLDRSAAQGWYRQSLELYRENTDNWGAAVALCGLGEIALQTGRINDSIACYEESLTHFRALGDPRSSANSLIGLGNALFRVGRLGEGEECIAEVITIYTALGDRAGIARSQLNLARAFFWQGRFAEVLNLLEQCRPAIVDLGLKYDQIFLLGVSALIHSLLKRYSHARRDADQLFTLCQEIKYPRMSASGYTSLGMAALAHGEYNQARDEFQKAVNILREVDQRDELAAMTGLLAGAYLKIGNLGLTGQLLCAALQGIVELRAVWGASWAMPWVALYLARRGNLEKALEVYTLCGNLPIVANSPWYAKVVGEEITATTGELPPEIITAAQERGCELDLWQTAAELLEELEQSDYSRVA